MRNNQRHGKWVLVDSLSDKAILSKGRYRQGKAVGNWITLLGDTLIRKEKYRKDKIYTQYFYPNGLVSSEGIAFMRYEGDSIHYTLDGEWKFYDEQGSFIGNTIYRLGELIEDEAPIAPSSKQNQH